MDIKKYEKQIELKTYELFNDEWIPEEIKEIIPELSVEFINASKNAQRWRTKTEKLFSVLNDYKHPTNNSKYWQALKELKVMVEQLIIERNKRERLLLDLEEITLDINDVIKEDTPRNKLKFKRLQIDFKEKEFLISKLTYDLQHRMRECLNWVDILYNLRKTKEVYLEDPNTGQIIDYFMRFKNEILNIIGTFNKTNQLDIPLFNNIYNQFKNICRIIIFLHSENFIKTLIPNSNIQAICLFCEKIGIESPFVYKENKFDMCLLEGLYIINKEYDEQISNMNEMLINNNILDDKLKKFDRE